jgi:2-hydroxy-3-keto-5-methylthiopentenyl-1-phosphate phosphatase
MPGRVRVFVDFDGTISLEDTTDVILERFADSAWQRVETDWLSGRIGSRDCLAQQIDLVRATPQALDAICDDVPLDPHFPDFVALCRTNDVDVVVISDGLDRIVTKKLADAGVNVPVLANRLNYLGDSRWKLEFPYASPLCRAAAGNCKCMALTKDPASARVLVGDGRSDFCAAETADLVIAKGALAEHCEVSGINYTVFGNFAGATTVLADWFATFERNRAASYQRISLC